MDPLSQATFGSSASQSLASQNDIKWALLIGALAGMAPDLDILITSDVNPMVYFKYHRHFTHSLIFIPFGALIISLILHVFVKNKISFTRNYLFSFAGYATHGLLDSCTSYGTLLFWPFSDYRVAWNNVSIIDPILTLPLVTLCIFGLKKKSKTYTQVGLVYAILYLGMGLIQNNRANELGHKIAQSRGHVPERLVAKPSFANLILWRIIYEYDGHFYTDAVRVGLSQNFYPGEKTKKLDLAKDFPWIKKDSQHFMDIKKFSWFSNHFLAIHPDDPMVIGDIRYSIAPDSVYPLWGIRVIEGRDQDHVKRANFRKASLKLRSRFLELLFEPQKGVELDVN